MIYYYFNSIIFPSQASTLVARDKYDLIQAGVRLFQEPIQTRQAKEMNARISDEELESQAMAALAMASQNEDEGEKARLQAKAADFGAKADTESDIADKLDQEVSDINEKAVEAAGKAEITFASGTLTRVTAGARKHLPL